MFGFFIGIASWAIGAPKQSRYVSRRPNERGFVLVFTSISILVLTAIGGIAVDIGNWYLNAQRLQRAADAASLAGAPYLPGNPTAAYAAAQQALEQNGIQAVSTTVQVGPTVGPDEFKPVAFIGQDPAHANVMTVDVGVKVKNYFLSLINVNNPFIHRKGNATYQVKVPMGSPGNTLGSEPVWSGATEPGDQSVQSDADAYNAHYWLNISGGLTDKITGDRYTAGKCSNGTDGCSAGINTEVGAGTNSDGNLRAHQYIVHINANIHQPVTLQAFDAAYVDVGDHCDSADTYGASLGTSALQAVATADHSDPSLYAKGAASQYCTGDFNQGYGSGEAPKLSFTVQKADTNDNATGSALTTKTFEGLKYSSSTNLATYLASHNALRDQFRKWADVYTFTSPGDYVITATTPDNSGGTNRFSLRVGVGNSTTGWDTFQSKYISVYSKYALAVYTNATAADTSFYFAQLTDNAAGRDLVIELYDIGDVPSGETVDLQLLAPTGASGRIKTQGFDACAQQGPVSTAIQPLQNCTIQNASSSAGYNGKVVKLHIKVPDDYSCTDDGSKKCWMSLRFNLHGAGGISASNPSTDTTTWQIDDCGSPLKLVKNDFSGLACGAGD